MSTETNAKINKLSKIVGTAQASSASVGITGSIFRMSDLSKSEIREISFFIFSSFSVFQLQTQSSEGDSANATSVVEVVQIFIQDHDSVLYQLLAWAVSLILYILMLMVSYPEKF